MNIQLIEKPFRYVLIDDFYDEDELKLVKEEITAFAPYGLTASKTGSKSNAKTGTGLFLDKFFSQDRTTSKILNANRKLFCDEIYEKAVSLDSSFGAIKHVDLDVTLINYYQDKEEYKSHKDFCPLTALTFFSIGDFTGGDFYFPDYYETVKFKENRLVMFPGCVSHQALPINAEKGCYRVSIAQFLSYVPK